MNKFYVAIIFIMIILFALIRPNSVQTNEITSIVKKERPISKSSLGVDSVKLNETHTIQTENETKPIMTDKEFMDGEVSYAQKSLYENEVGYCLAQNSNECISYREEYYENHKFDDKCFLARKDCLENTFSSVTPEELLVVFQPERVIHYLIEREKTENYIKDPINNGSALFDQNWYEMKLRSFYSNSKISPQSN